MFYVYQNLFLHSFCKDLNCFFFLSRGYNLFTAYLKDLISKIRIQMEKNMRMNFLKQRITVILLLVASVCICGSINEFYFFENDYYFKYLLNTFTGIILLTGIAYLCYPQKKTNQENELVLNEYKLVYETESTASQYFISDTEAWNTLRKQLKTTAQGHAILYISESCELPIINNTILAKKRNFDCWKPVCAGQISKDFGEI